MDVEFAALRSRFDGEIHSDRAMLTLFSTDASIYQSMPTAVAFPKNKKDIGELIRFAHEKNTSLIARTAGTSLAGQVVGEGIIVDVSRFMNRVLDFDPDSKTVRVEPGVVRDELNLYLASQGVYFAPETSTSNRAMIGGMLGNNSCGANSIVCGGTRDHVVSVSGFLSDGSYVTLGPTDPVALQKILDRDGDDLESRIYRVLLEMLNSPENRAAINKGFPDAGVRRRNTGYAIDELMNCAAFSEAIRCETANAGGCDLGQTELPPLNLAKLVAGSEGTLFIATEIVLQCLPLPPKESLLVCAQFSSVNAALVATGTAMKSKPWRCELIDDLVINGARRNSGLSERTKFLGANGDTPAAVLLIEFRAHDPNELASIAAVCVNALEGKFPLMTKCSILDGQLASDAWAVRRSGLGVVNSVFGDEKPITLIEDTAVSLDRLPDFIEHVDNFLETFGLTCVHYGHAGAGELHLRPRLDLKQDSDREKIRAIATGVAGIVKRFGGSLSGEHGDGRLRSELIEAMVGPRCYELLKQIKTAFDPSGIFNPGKIVDAVPLDTDLRCRKGLPIQPASMFRFTESGSLLAAVELCSGSGDCRKSHLSGGTMCPSYMASRREYDTTRARAGLLRDLLTRADVNTAFDDLQGVADVKDVMELCLSCKACKSECPSNVDMAKIKSEFMHAYYQLHKPSMLTRRLARFEEFCESVSRVPFADSLLKNSAVAGFAKRVAGIHPRRSLPKIARRSLKQRLSGTELNKGVDGSRNVVLFVDEFTNWIDVEIGMLAVRLMQRLGYSIRIVDHVESGRTALSLGMLDQARQFAETNVAALAPVVGPDCKLVGIEPSALFTLTDEYPDLVSESLVGHASQLASHTFLLEEFLADELDSGRLDTSVFTERRMNVVVHGHCHQKALGDASKTAKLLAAIPGANVELLAAGCCGMAGSFGYQADKFEMSMQIGELVLFPAIETAFADSNIETLVVAGGTSCRHQILDGTGKSALHPIELVWRCMPGK